MSFTDSYNKIASHRLTRMSVEFGKAALCGILTLGTAGIGTLTFAFGQVSGSGYQSIGNGLLFLMGGAAIVCGRRAYTHTRQGFRILDSDLYPEAHHAAQPR